MPLVRSAKPHVAKNTKEWALMQAKNFCSILKPLGMDGIRLVQVEYQQEINHRYDPVSFMTGFWRCQFQRYSRAGYPIVNDRVSVEINEDYGLSAYSDKCLTAVDESEIWDAKIDRKTIQRLAVGYAKKTMAESLAVRSYFNGHVLESTPLDMQLVVVCPNDLLTSKDLGDIRANRKARLVWLVKFRLNGSGCMAAGTLAIYVDAQTGEFNGGAC